ncbi:MAG: hypothetical protein H6R04_737 [Burkholderiaceae bacterium]|nr:hypothetical protein [Burkholderiaceae bacterium]
MTSKNGIYVSPTEFVQFGGNRRQLGVQLATRNNRPDFNDWSMLLPNPDPVLKKLGKDIQVYRDLRTEPQVGGNIRRRKGAVLALEHGIDRGKAKSRAAALIESVFARLPMNRIISEILDASLYGYQPIEVVWGKVGGYIVPVDLIGKPAEWFHFDLENQLRLKTRQSPIDGELLPERKFLLPRQDASYDNPYGFADLSMCFWPTAFKKGGLTFWVQFSEKYGSPWLVGKHPRNTPPSETDAFLEQLADMVQDAVAVIPDDSSVEIVEAQGKGGSAGVFERLLMFCRSEVNIALLGQNQTSEANSTNASAQAGFQVTRDIRDADKLLVEDTLNELIGWIHDLNFGDGVLPKFQMWEQEEVDEVLAKRDKLLTDSGAQFTPAYFRRAYGLQDGDLVEVAESAATASTAEFAESENGFPDQEALDAALEELSLEDLNQDAKTMLTPLFKRVAAGVPPDELLGELADLYPGMDADGLQERLARVIFVADLWGRLHA